MVKRKKKYIPLPMKIIDQFERKYSSEIWEKGPTPLFDFSDFDSVRDFLEKEYHASEEDIAETNAHEKYISYRLWLQYQVVYQFDETLAEELFLQGKDIKVPVDILHNLPYPCFFIQWSKKAGMFVREYQNSIKYVSD